MLPPTLYDAAEELPAERRVTIDSEAALATKSPVLHQFVKSIGSLREHRRHLAEFMGQLLQAANGLVVKPATEWSKEESFHFQAIFNGMGP